MAVAERTVIVLFWLGGDDVRFLEDEGGHVQRFHTTAEARAAVSGHLLDHVAMIANLNKLEPA
jgi:hypothetical protein